MAVLKENIWTSMKATLDQANQLADFFNKNLVPAHRVEIVRFSDSWFSIVGTLNAKATCDRLTREIEKSQKEKEELIKQD